MKYIDNFFKAFSDNNNVMFILSTIIVATFIVVMLTILVAMLCAYLAAAIGPQVFLAIPILAFIRVGYAVWTGK